MLHPDASRGWNAPFFSLCDIVCHINVRFVDMCDREGPVPGDGAGPRSFGVFSARMPCRVAACSHGAHGGGY